MLPSTQGDLRALLVFFSQYTVPYKSIRLQSHTSFIIWIQSHSAHGDMAKTISTVSHSNHHGYANGKYSNHGNGSTHPVDLGAGSYGDATSVGSVSSTSTTKEDLERSLKKKRKCCPYGPKVWCKKYWWEGQELQKEQDPLEKRLEGRSWARRILIKYRRVIGFCIPALLFHLFWWAYFIKFSPWELFPDKYAMTITMVFGSIIAGMTSEGGGAVAFPVMTLILDVDPSVARDFTLMIQSCGMSCASFTIFFMGVRVEWHSIICCSIGAIGGLIFGLHVVDPNLSANVKKLGFVSIWFAFASVLIFINRTAKRRTFKRIQNFNWWRFLTLVLAGFLGGIFTSFSGSGLDISSFMILTLLFRVSEKVATPTSVILMAFNSLVGFVWRGVIMDAITVEALEYLAVCLPVVVIGAPVGSVLGSHFHRLVLAGLVIVLDTVAIATAFAIIRPLTPELIGGCCAVIVGCFGIFMGLSYAGQKLLDKYEEKENLSADGKDDDDSSSDSDPESDNSDTDYNGEFSKQPAVGNTNEAFVPENEMTTF